MRQFRIGPNQAGQRLDKYLHKILPEAGNGFLYKMLRKKNITLNGKKAEGREGLREEDVVTFFLAEETFLKFAGESGTKPEVEPDAKSGTKPEVEPGAKSGIKPEAKPGVESGTKPEAEPGAKSGIKPEVEPGAKSGIKPEAKPGTGMAGAEKSGDGMPSSDRVDACGSRGPDLYNLYNRAYRELEQIQVVYEDDNIVALNKPAGILTQKAKAGDISLNEWLIGYLLDRGSIDAEELRSFKPSVCNRLDRNTSGLVLCGKSLAGSQALSEMIRKRSLSKYYSAICVGEMQGDCVLDGRLVKDRRSNRVRISPEATGKTQDPKIREQKKTEQEIQGQKNQGQKNLEQKNQEQKTEAYIRTVCRLLAAAGGYSLLEIELVTGKPHQIRAHLASIGHPIIGDYKYGDRHVNDRLRGEFGLEHQLLHAGRVVFPDGREIRAAEPELFGVIRRSLGLMET